MQLHSGQGHHELTVFEDIPQEDMFFTSPQTEERKTIEMNSNVSG
jgi:hypothetical protein